MTLMWEARAAPGRLQELVDFVRDAADPAAQLYCSDGPDPRVVLIDPSERGIIDVPDELVARAPHAWRFRPVER